MTALANSVASLQHIGTHFLSGNSTMQVEQCLSSGNVFLVPTSQSTLKPLKCKRSLTVKARPCHECSVLHDSTKRIIGREKDEENSCSSFGTAGGDGGRPGSASIFVSGFVLGGIVVGALSAIYAPQISKALAGTDRKDLMRKLPKFIYDEEKALERTRKILTEKIEQLNSAIDDVSAQLRADDTPNGAAVTSDELEASI